MMKVKVLRIEAMDDMLIYKNTGKPWWKNKPITLIRRNTIYMLDAGETSINLDKLFYSIAGDKELFPLSQYNFFRVIS